MHWQVHIQVEVKLESVYRITENSNPSSESLSTPLKNVLNNIEADIEAILRKNVKQDSERRKSVRLSTNLIAQKVSRTSAAQQANARSSPKPDSVSTIIAANIDSDKDDIDALYLAFSDTQQQLGGLEKMIEDLIGKAISLIDIPSPSGQLSVISPAPLSATRQMVYSNIHVK
ncbi:hypothetical protein BSLG_006069 [Batrachochytrium salamandrivorans]|nr:hypothetical protein BSLG_006069 [Batrachochytrium salamandrivorans]